MVVSSCFPMTFASRAREFIEKEGRNCGVESMRGRRWRRGRRGDRVNGSSAVTAPPRVLFMGVARISVGSVFNVKPGLIFYAI